MNININNHGRQLGKAIDVHEHMVIALGTQGRECNSKAASV
jgi:hypothetical protein